MSCTASSKIQYNWLPLYSWGCSISIGTLLRVAYVESYLHDLKIAAKRRQIPENFVAASSLCISCTGQYICCYKFWSWLFVALLRQSYPNPPAVSRSEHACFRKNVHQVRDNLLWPFTPCSHYYLTHPVRYESNFTSLILCVNLRPSSFEIRKRENLMYCDQWQLHYDETLSLFIWRSILIQNLCRHSDCGKVERRHVRPNMCSTPTMKRSENSDVWKTVACTYIYPIWSRTLASGMNLIPWGSITVRERR